MVSSSTPVSCYGVHLTRVQRFDLDRRLEWWALFGTEVVERRVRSGHCSLLGDGRVRVVQDMRGELRPTLPEKRSR